MALPRSNAPARRSLEELDVLHVWTSVTRDCDVHAGLNGALFGVQVRLPTRGRSAGTGCARVL